MIRKISSLAVLLFFAALLASPMFGAGSTLYPWPTDFSYYGMASWSQPLFASGTALPAAGNAFPGEIFINLATAGQPTIWRRGASSWELMAGGTTGGSGSGVASHSLLAELDFASSGHTGFASTGALLDRAASSTVSDHIAKQIDPHGATMTVSVTMVIGSGTEDCYITRLATGIVEIGSYTRVVPLTATPTGTLATGTLWYDQNTNKLRCYDGSAWNNLW